MSNQAFSNPPPYDVPRKISLTQLAERLNLALSTLDVHLKKAERRLLSHIINES